MPSARHLVCIRPGALEIVWVVDWPLLEWNDDEGRWDSLHHPFTAPTEESVSMLDKNPGAAPPSAEQAAPDPALVARAEALALRLLSLAESLEQEAANP